MKIARFFPLVMVLFFLAPSTQATENRFSQFNADTADAYSFYRKALFQTNKQDQTKSAQALQQFQGRWQNIVEQYGSMPPEPYRSDPSWLETLEKINKLASQGMNLIQQSHLSEAHEVLEPIRDELGALRQRNSVIVFSDHVNNYHRVMESLLEKAWKPGDLDSKAINTIRETTGALKYLAAAIKDNAPRAYREDDAYKKLQEGLFSSIKDLQDALDSNDPAQIAKTVKMLKPAYAKLFVKFG